MSKMWLASEGIKLALNFFEGENKGSPASNKSKGLSNAFDIVKGASKQSSTSPEQDGLSKAFGFAKDKLSKSKGESSAGEGKKKDGIMDGFSGTVISGLMSLHPAGRAVLLGATVISGFSSAIGMNSEIDNDNTLAKNTPNNDNASPDYVFSTDALKESSEKSSLGEHLDIASAMGAKNPDYMNSLSKNGSNSSLVSLCGNPHATGDVLDDALMEAFHRQEQTSDHSSTVLRDVTRKLADHPKTSPETFELLTKTDDPLTAINCLLNSSQISKEQTERILGNFSSLPSIAEIGQHTLSQSSSPLTETTQATQVEQGFFQVKMDELAATSISDEDISRVANSDISSSQIILLGNPAASNDVLEGVWEKLTQLHSSHSISNDELGNGFHNLLDNPQASEKLLDKLLGKTPASASFSEEGTQVEDLLSLSPVLEEKTTNLFAENTTREDVTIGSTLDTGRGL